MNERIRELARQAENLKRDEVSYRERLHNRYCTGDMEEEIFREKFAELIVRECANLCDLLLDHKISSEWSRGTHDCSRAIKKHFGVEQ